MAENTISLKVLLEADTANMKLGQLEEHFAELQARIREVPRGSKEFDQLSQSIAGTSAEIQNIEAGFEGLGNEAVAGQLGGLAGGIGEVTASLVLMGGENETMQEMAASIEKAMAISMGFKGAIEGLSAASKLYNNLLKQGKVQVMAKAAVEKVAAVGTWMLNAANKALNTTMKMNPIGLVITALTVVVGAIIYFKDEIWSLIKTALKPFQYAIDAVVDALQWLGIMESDSAIATRKAEEEKAQAAIDSAKKRTEATEKLIKDHKRMTDSIVEDMDWEIRKRQANGEDTKKIEADKLEFLIESAKKQKELQQQKIKDLAAEEWARLKSGKFTLKGLKETAEGIKQALDEGIEATETVKELEQEVTINQITENKKRRDSAKKAAADQKKIDEKAAEDAKLAAEKAVADALALEIEKNQLLEDLEAKAIEDKTTRSLAELEIAQERERQQLIEKYGLDTELLKALETEQLLQMNTLIAGIEQEARENKATLDQEARDKEAAAKKAQRDKDFALATAAVGALSALNDAALATDLLNAAGNDEKQEEIRRASFERQKKLNIAMAAINGAQAVIAGFAQGGLPMAVLAGVTAAAQLAAIVATTYQSSASPTEVEETVPTPDGAGGGGGGVQLSPVTNTSTILGNQQVFVTETDITNTQNNVSVIEDSATF
jgi:hypothetical protein